MGQGSEQPVVADPALWGGSDWAMLGFLGFSKIMSPFVPTSYFRGLAIHPDAGKLFAVARRVTRWGTKRWGGQIFHFTGNKMACFLSVPFPCVAG